MDYFLFQQINGWAGNFLWLDTLAIFLAKYLGYFLLISVFLFFWRKWKVILESFLAAVFARFGLAELIRFFWFRPRPFEEKEVNLLLDKINQASFPSGHAIFFFALSAVIFLHNKKTGLGFFLASFFIALSRVFVGLHWPSDILAGLVLGIFSGWLIWRILKNKKK